MTPRIIRLVAILIISKSITAQISISGEMNYFDFNYLTVNWSSHNDIVEYSDTIYFADTFSFEKKIRTNSAFSLTFVPNSEITQRINLYLLGSPGQDIQISGNLYNTLNDLPQITFLDKNAKGRQLFQHFLSRRFIEYLIEVMDTISEDDNSIVAMAKFESFLSKVIRPFDELLLSNDIDSIYHKIVTDYIETGMINVLAGRFYRTSNNYNLNDPKESKKFIKQMIDQCPTMEEIDLLTGSQLTFVALNQSIKFAIEKNFSKFSDVKDSIAFIHEKEVNIENTFVSILGITNYNYKELLYAHWLKFFYKTNIGMTERYEGAMEYFKFLYPKAVILII